ncbi:GNAT family protein [Kribbella sp. NPDC051770]|uniref:GNAT family N-acetyltransferase n=1 Tax=Kribbella sp. NPDC051770 TaxID=3155413 RepID=UPI003434E632
MDPLTGDGVGLREFRPDDFDDFFAVVGDERVTAWMAFATHTPESARKMLDGIVERSAQESRPDYMLAVTRLDDDRVLGFIRLAPGIHKGAKLGYGIGADQWGHGYATTACRLVLDFAFGPLALHRVTAAIGPENAASIAVVQRLGFSYEGLLRDHVFTNDAWRDSVLYSVLADEWTAQQP